jgi:hypothetical protein
MNQRLQQYARSELDELFCDTIVSFRQACVTPPASHC